MDEDLFLEALAAADASLQEWSPAARAAALVSRRKHHGGAWGKNLTSGSGRPGAPVATLPSRAVRTRQRREGDTMTPAKRTLQIERLTAKLEDASPAERARLMRTIGRLRAAQLGTRTRVTEAWSPAARAAALASRRKHHGSKWGKHIDPDAGHAMDTTPSPERQRAKPRDVGEKTMGKVVAKVEKTAEKHTKERTPGVKEVYQHIDAAHEESHKTPGPHGTAKLRTPNGEVETHVWHDSGMHETKLPNGDMIKTKGTKGEHAVAVAEKLEALRKQTPRKQRGGRSPHRAIHLRGEEDMWYDIAKARGDMRYLVRHARPGDPIYALEAAVTIASTVLEASFEQHVGTTYRVSKTGKRYRVRPHTRTMPGKVRSDAMLRIQLGKMGGKGSSAQIARDLGTDTASVHQRLTELPAFEHHADGWRVKTEPDKPKGRAPKEVPDYWTHIGDLIKKNNEREAKRAKRAANRATKRPAVAVAA